MKKASRLMGGSIESAWITVPTIFDSPISSRPLPVPAARTVWAKIRDTTTSKFPSHRFAPGEVHGLFAASIRRTPASDDCKAAHLRYGPFFIKFYQWRGTLHRRVSSTS